MLVLMLTTDQVLQIGDDVTICLADNHRGGRAMVAIEAPRSVPIVRRPRPAKPTTETNHAHAHAVHG